eukprot:gene10064-2486_t
MSVKFLLLLFFISFTLGDISKPDVSPGEYPEKNFISFQGTMKVYWKTLNITGKPALEFAVETETEGWAALGFNSDDGMVGLDVIMGRITDEGTLLVEDKYVTGTTAPIKDTEWDPPGENNIIAKNGGKKDGIFTFKFQRFFVTGDSRDKEIFKGAENTLYVAYSISNLPNTKHAFYRRAESVDFEAPNITQLEYIVYPIQYMILVGVFVIVCIFGVISQFSHRIPILDKVFHGRLLPPIVHWIGDYVNEYFNMSLGELFVIDAYIFLSVTWIAMSTYHSIVDTSNIIHIIAKVSGQLNLLNFGFVLLPVTRHSIWNFVFGIPFDRAIKYHRWVGFWSYLCLIFHFIFMGIHFRNDFLRIFSLEYTHGIQQFYQTDGFGFIVFGFASFVSCTIMLFVTIFRRWFFNTFYLFHILFSVSTIIFASLHHYYALIHMIIPIILYLFDFAIRKVKGVIPAKIVDIRDFGEVTKLEISSPIMKKFSPGQYVFVTIPRCLNVQNPFSISCAPGGDTFTLHIKEMKRVFPTFTSSVKKLAKKCEKGELDCEKIAIRLEGPYGNTSIHYDNYQAILLAAGGIGVTPMISMLQHYSSLLQEGKTKKLQKIYFVWVVRTVDSLEWFEELFNSIKHSKYVQLIIHVTRPNEESDNLLSNKVEYEKGRPIYSDIFDEIENDFSDQRLFGCYACGPSVMISTLDKICWKRSSIKKSWHFHKETFLL